MTDEAHTKRELKTHRFLGSVEWTGGRSWVIRGETTEGIEGGPPPQFRGESGKWSPEDLFLGSINSCQLGAFMYYARMTGLEFVSYTSEIEGFLEPQGGSYEFTKIFIRPNIVVTTVEEQALARECTEKGHHRCFMGNSTKAEIVVEPEITVQEAEL